MISIEKSGKTVEDAVQAGLKELGKESSEVTIDVLEYGSPGLFGMFGKLARVRLTVKEDDPEIDFEMPILSLDQQPAKKPSKKSEQKKPEPKKAEPKKPEPVPVERPIEAEAQVPSEPEAPREQSATAREAEAREARPPRKRQPREAAKRSDTPRRDPLPPAKMEDLPPLDLDSLSEDGKKAYAFLQELTTLMNCPVEIRVQENDGHMAIQMIGDTLGVLIGRRGETLDALQYLTSLQVNKGREEYLRVTLDTEYYRARREEALNRLAERMANRVRRTGHRVALEPMNPYERRVLHSALQGHDYVTTHSEGEEPYRRVVITLKS